jgi:hypothetical protein
MLSAKMGQLGSHVHRVSNKGSISDIRSRMGGVIEGGIPRYAMLGSQNAISGSIQELAEELTKKNNDDLAKKIADDIAKVIPKETEPKTKPLPVSPILPGQPKKEKPLLGGSGGGIQSEESISEHAKEPSHQPPYYLPYEQSKLNERIKFMEDHYGKKVSLKFVEDLKRDSVDFSEAVEKAKMIGKAINKWKSKDLGKEWLLNQMKDIGKWVLNKATELAKNSINLGAGSVNVVATEISKVALDELKNVIEKSALTPEYFEQTMKAIQDALFSARPYWKAKWDILVSAENKRAKEEFVKYLKDLVGPTSGSVFPFKKKKTVVI